ncbi:DUF2612 domain-containing protein [Agrobacterium rhizogenes]|uniref:DUF2612 domain-containing protein n=1 Tax=Rhizobium rhizogenes TaxID=359 RepID=UPI001573781A|nr:DUF2612 domain-containing protein [Rhizobium rhizogenes]NTG86216.1 DUF2612 domain-containing protein [Rhizobium rhizogenes]
MATVDDYLGEISSYHRGKPKFTATITALVQPFVNTQAFLGSLPHAFDVDYSIGVQEDADGEWIGISRNIPVPIPNVWFSFDDDKRGFDLGIWKGPYDSDTGITVLDDETYRTLLRAKIAANNWDGTVENAPDAFSIIFPPPSTARITLEGLNPDGSYSILTGLTDSGLYAALTALPPLSGTLLFVLDNGDMTMTVGVAGQIPSLLFLAILELGLLPIKPAAVRVNYEITSVNNSPVFGFDVQNEYIAGFDTGAWGVDPTYFTS